MLTIFKQRRCYKTCKCQRSFTNNWNWLITDSFEWLSWIVFAFVLNLFSSITACFKTCEHKIKYQRTIPNQWLGLCAILLAWHQVLAERVHVHVFRLWHRVSVFTRLESDACFLLQWVHVLPRFAPGACFPALGLRPLTLIRCDHSNNRY